MEVCIEKGVVSEIRNWTSPYRKEAGLWLSPAFVNAHSHLEYYDLKNLIPRGDYWEFIQALIALKPTRAPERIVESSLMAAQQNLRTGVTILGEWSDFPASGKAMRKTGLRGHIFQEVITFFEHEEPSKKLHHIRKRAKQHAEESKIPVHLAPHSLFTTAETVIREIGRTEKILSIHIAESKHEWSFLVEGRGPIAEFYQKHHIPFEATRTSPIKLLDKLALLNECTQLVHACVVSPEDIDLIAQSRASVVHCPRSNQNLQCPPAPVAQMLSKGICVGLGMDSAASSGEIDFFAEMRAALNTAKKREEPLSAEMVWQMATEGGARSLHLQTPWYLQIGAQPDLILLDAKDCTTLLDMIQKGDPTRIRRVIPLYLCETE